MSEIEIQAELTPNPNTLKFAVNRELLSAGSRNFPDRESAHGHPFLEALFKIDFVAGVMIGTDFITVTKKPDVEWPLAAVPVVDAIREFFKVDRPLLMADAPAAHAAAEQGGIAEKIIEILDNEIRPAVARDGGDIIFYGYDEGVVKLHLQGACSSCPSSLMTLKVGIENRLKMTFPEIKEVIQV